MIIILLNRALISYRDPTPSKWQVYAGVHDLKAASDEASFQMLSVKRVIIHSGFDLKTFDNDIALIELSKSLRFSSAISPVCLPDDNDQVQHGQKTIITGWGNPREYFYLHNSVIFGIYCKSEEDA